MLEKEREFYAEHLPDWLAKYAGRVVLVKEQKLVGVYDTENEALSEGARQFGATSFLVRRVLPAQQEVSIPALTLGLLNADSIHSVHGTGANTGR